MSQYQDRTGQRYGRLVVLGPDPDRVYPSGRKHKMFRCLCDCGRYAVVDTNRLRSGTTKSCGCLARDAWGQNSRTHGEAKRSGSLYQTWRNIKTRCLNPRNPGFVRYGGRGIGLYRGWQDSYEAFRDWVISTLGARPSRQHSLDRIDNDGPYQPGNLRWATPSDQTRNSCRSRLDASDVAEIRRLRSEGVPRSDVASRFGVSKHTITDIVKGRTWAK